MEDDVGGVLFMKIVVSGSIPVSSIGQWSGSWATPGLAYTDILQVEYDSSEGNSSILDWSNYMHRLYIQGNQLNNYLLSWVFCQDLLSILIDLALLKASLKLHLVEQNKMNQQHLHTQLNLMNFYFLNAIVNVKLKSIMMW